MRYLSVLIGLVFVGCTAFFGASKSVATEQHQWSVGPALPIAMQEIYPVVFNERILVGGGFTPSDSDSFFGLAPSKEVFLLNPSRKRWVNAPSLPAPRHHLGMVSNRHYVYGIGGFTGAKGNAWQIQRTVFRLDSNLQRWRNGPSLPIPMAESVYANVGKNIHVIGGRTLSKQSGKNIDTNAHFVLVNNAYWRKAAPASIERNSAASAVIGNKIYVIGGRTSGENAKNLNAAEVYDVERDTWTAIAPLPMASGGLSASVFEGKIIVTGGEKFGAKSDWRTGRAFDNAWAYDPGTDQWQALNALPEPRHGHGMVTLNDQLYIIGGASQVGPKGTTSSVFKK